MRFMNVLGFQKLYKQNVTIVVGFSGHNRNVTYSVVITSVLSLTLRTNYFEVTSGPFLLFMLFFVLNSSVTVR